MTQYGPAFINHRTGTWYRFIQNLQDFFDSAGDRYQGPTGAHLPEKNEDAPVYNYTRAEIHLDPPPDMVFMVPALKQLGAFKGLKEYPADAIYEAMKAGWACHGGVWLPPKETKAQAGLLAQAAARRATSSTSTSSTAQTPQQHGKTANKQTVVSRPSTKQHERTVSLEPEPLRTEGSESPPAHESSIETTQTKQRHNPPTSEPPISRLDITNIIADLLRHSGVNISQTAVRLTAGQEASAQVKTEEEQTAEGETAECGVPNVLEIPGIIPDHERIKHQEEFWIPDDDAEFMLNSLRKGFPTANFDRMKELVAKRKQEREKEKPETNVSTVMASTTSATAAPRRTPTPPPPAASSTSVSSKSKSKIPEKGSLIQKGVSTLKKIFQGKSVDPAVEIERSSSHASSELSFKSARSPTPIPAQNPPDLPDVTDLPGPTEQEFEAYVRDKEAFERRQRERKEEDEQSHT